MASQSYMRVGDAEREATAGELREHFASGRLTQEEFDERLNQTFAAKTKADLDAVLRDLPSVRPLATSAPRSDYGSGAWSSSGASGSSGAGTGRRMGILTGAMAALWSMVLVFGVLDLGFGGFGTRPIGIGLILAALAMLRRLFFGRIFGRRRGWGGPRGPRGRRR